MNEYEEGSPLFPLHVVSVGSLRGLLVGLSFECKPLVHSSQVRHPLGGGPPIRPVVIVRPLPIKALTALISRRRMGLVRGLVILPVSVWWTIASRRFLFELVFLALRLDGVRNFFSQFTNIQFLGFRFCIESECLLSSVMLVICVDSTISCCLCL